MNRRASTLLLALLSGCSFVFDPDDHLGAAAPDPCDADGDGFVAATEACGGDDCDDASAARYPGAPPACDGFQPNDCHALEFATELREAFGVEGGRTVDFGHLPLHTLDTLAAPMAPEPPTVDVRIVGYEATGGPQASVAFVAGGSAEVDPSQVWLFDYDATRPEQGQMHDPELGLPSAFAFGALGPNTARVYATRHGFQGTGTFLASRDVGVGAERPMLISADPTLADGPGGGTIGVAPTVALLGAYDPILETAFLPQVHLVFTTTTTAGSVWTHAPAGTDPAQDARIVGLPNGSEGRILSGVGAEAFFALDNSTDLLVWRRTADSGSASSPSGLLTTYTGLPNRTSLPIDPLFFPLMGAVDDTTASYLVSYVDTSGVARVGVVACVRLGIGTASEQSTCTPPQQEVAVTNLSTVVESLAAVRAPGGALIVAASARESAGQQRGVLLYHVSADSQDPLNTQLRVRPLAHVDAQGRPWLVPLGGAFDTTSDRLSVTLLDAPYGASQRWTILVAGLSDHLQRGYTRLTVAGVTACVP